MNSIEAISVDLQIPQRIRDLTTQWLQYCVKWVKNASLYLKNGWIAGATLVGYNVICFELILSICRIAQSLLYPSFSYDQLSEEERNAMSFRFMLGFSTSIGLANWTFWKLLQPSLTIAQMVIVSTATCFTYLYLKTQE